MPDTIVPYGLRVPKDDELADVPADLTRLASDVSTALNGKLTAADASTIYQKKIKIFTGAGIPVASDYVEGDIVFVIQ